MPSHKIAKKKESGSKHNLKCESLSVVKWLKWQIIKHLTYFSIIYLTNTAWLRQWYATCDMLLTPAFKASSALVTTTNSGLDATCKKVKKKIDFFLLHCSVLIITWKKPRVPLMKQNIIDLLTCLISFLFQTPLESHYDNFQCS